MSKQESYRNLKILLEGFLHKSYTLNVLFEVIFRKGRGRFSLVVIFILIIFAAFADLIAPYTYYTQDLSMAFQLPSLNHILGTDHLGRDILSRLIYGTRIVVYVIILTVVISTSLGTAIGALSGYFGGITDHIVSRLTDIILSFPYVLFALIVLAVVGPGLNNAIIAIALSQTAPFIRLVRGQVLKVKEMEYVEGAKAVGASGVNIILKHVLPNALAPIIVQSTFNAGGAIIGVASLSFLGLGAQPPTPGWGAMIYETRLYFRNAPQLMIYPGIAILLITLCLNILGDAIRDALDPKSRITMGIVVERY